MELKFEQPPEEALARTRGRRGAYAEIAEELRKHKDQWALLPRTFTTEKSASGTAQNIRRGKVKGFERGEYEAVHHETKVWVRWTGPVEDPTTGPLDDGLNRTIRDWAREQGHEVADRGRLPRAIVDEYFAAHDDVPRPASLRAVQ